MNPTAKTLRKMLNGPAMVLAPFVFDALQAKVAESVGFEAVYMTGFGTAAARARIVAPSSVTDLIPANAESGTSSIARRAFRV